MTTKKVLLMVGLLAAIGVGVWSYSGFPPNGDGEEGAIGAANRYADEQISDADVILKDAEVVALLQDDVFLELIQDEDFQALLARGNEVGTLGKNGIPGVLGKQSLPTFLARPDVGYLGSHDIGGLLRTGQIQELQRAAIAQPDWNRSQVELNRQIVDVLGKHNIGEITIGQEKNKKSWNRNQIADGLSRMDAAALMARPEVDALLRNASFIDALGKNAMVSAGELERAQAIGDYLGRNHPDVLGKHMVAAGGWDRAKMSVTETVLGKNNVAALLAQPKVVDYFGRKNVQAAFRTNEVETAFNRANIATTVERFNTSFQGDNDQRKGPKNQ